LLMLTLEEEMVGPSYRYPKGKQMGVIIPPVSHAIPHKVFPKVYPKASTIAWGLMLVTNLGGTVLRVVDVARLTLQPN
jgi:hypothetical protein